MAGKGGDYEGWVLRLIDKAEDIIHSYSLDSWIKFASDKLEGLTKSQVSSLREYRDLVFDLPETLGISVVERTRYRDAKGRWTRDTSATPVPSIVYRGEREKFISRGKADELLQTSLDGLGIRVKSKERG